MQSGASRRALSYLASKVHREPLPLSPRESAQLLNLLTTSFRQHLDRTHAVTAPSKGSPIHQQTPHSQTSAWDHIESILTNPLFARKPTRRASDASKGNAQAVLRDPLGWFLDQVAMGAADVSKAAICLQMLQRNGTETGSGSKPSASPRTRPAVQIAEWLRTSGVQTSRDFMTYNPDKMLYPLTKMLIEEGADAPLWEWLTVSPKQWAADTGLEPAKITDFRAHLLRSMVAAKTVHQPHLGDGLSVFLQAYKTEYGLDAPTLRKAGFYLINGFLARQKQSGDSAELHEAFMHSCQSWTGKWTRSVMAMLSLHHPTSPSSRAAVAYIRDPDGLAKHLGTHTPGKPDFLVHLSLQTARQCLAEENFSDAQFVLEFVRDTFPEKVGAKEQKKQLQENKKQQQRLAEDKNLEMLDQLLPA